MELLLLLDVSGDGKTNIVVVVLWVVAYSILHTTEIEKKKRKEIEEKSCLYG